MGKIESTKTSIFSQIKSNIQCPLCGKKFHEKISFIELNFHLYYCDKKKIIKSKSNIYLNNIIPEEQSQHYTHYKCKSLSKRSTKEINRDNSDIIKNTINDNDLQLAIDYNNEEDIYEEHLKERKSTDIKERYIELRNFLSEKKNQMNYPVNIEINSFSQMFKALKEINIYNDIKFIYEKKKNEKKNYCLNYAVNKYIKAMIKINRFHVIYEDNILSFSFSNKKLDFEMIGVILAILFIYPEIKIKYKFPLILFKMLINQRISLEDIKYNNTKLYEDLNELLLNKDISKLNLCYIYDENELILGGANIKINSFNVFDYVEKIVNYEMNKYKKQINIIKNIIYQFIPKKYIFYFNAEQLEQIINNPSIYIDNL